MTHSKLMVPVGPNEIVGPDRFGPSLWQGLHYITLGYPDEPTQDQKQKYKAFFLLLKDTLPCSLCAQHYSENLKKMPLTDEVLESKKSLVKWLIDFHNVVNEMKGKPVLDYNTALAMISTDIECKSKVVEKITELEPTYNTKLIYGLIGVLVTLGLIMIIYKKK